MSNEKVSQLPGVSSALATDIIYAIQGGISVQESLSQVLQLALSFDTLFFSGDPNGNVAGQTYQRCFDTLNNVLWICKTTGSATTAVWTTTFGTFTNGQIPIGRTGDSPILGNIIGGTGIAVTNGVGTITISTLGGILPVFEITTTSATMNPNSVYIANNPGLVSLLLPPTFALGDRIQILGKGAGGWRITQNAGQQVNIGQNASSVGVGGFVQSTAQSNSVSLLGTTANTNFTNLGAPQGILTTN